MERPFAVIDGELYINEALIGGSSVGMVRVGHEQIQEIQQSVSSLQSLIASESAARASADSDLAARLDSIQAAVTPRA